MSFDDGTIMRLYRQTVQDFSIYRGQEFTEEQMRALQDAANTMSAKMRAVRIVAASNVSKKDLQQRLIHKGESPEKAKEAVRWMEDLNLVDDRVTAESIVRKCIQKGYGLSRAKQMLYEKRIPNECWEDVLQYYPDQTEYIVSFLESHLVKESDPRQLRKVIDALLRRGHNYNQIRKALKIVEADIDTLPEG